MASDAYVAVLESTDPAAKQVDNESNVIGGATRYRQRVRSYQGDGNADPTKPWLVQLSNGAVGIDPRDRNWTITETVPVSLASNTPDVTDRSGRLLGHVTVDNASIAVTGTFWQATQSVSLASLPPLAAGTAVIGHVIVDSGSITASGTVTANIGTTNGLALDATLTGGNAQVQGNVGSGVTDAGNPLKIGGVFNTTQPTATTGQRIDAQSDSRGRLRVNIGQNASDATVSSLADAFNATTAALFTASVPMLYNGSTIDRARGDTTSGMWVQTKAEAATGTPVGVSGLPSLVKEIGGIDTLGNVRAVRSDVTGALSIGNDLLSPIGDMLAELRRIAFGLELLTGEDIDYVEA